MDYTALDSYPYYTESEKLVASLGYHLVELKVSPQHGTTHILAVITAADPSLDIGVDDCSKVHHKLLPFLEEKLGTDDTYMELTSPGMERNFSATRWKNLMEKQLCPVCHPYRKTRAGENSTT